MTETATLPEFEGQVVGVGVVLCGCSSTARTSAFQADDVGSIPITRSSTGCSCSLVLESAHIAQSVEHFLGKEEVTGSSPVVGSLN